jgi:O-antigen/teichoic acid export membrane protein
MSDADDQIINVFTNLLYVEIPLALLVIANLYLAFVKPGTGFFMGYNKILTILISVIILTVFVLSFMVIELPDTEDDLSTSLVIGMIFPAFLTILYACIMVYASFFKRSGSSVSAAPAAPAPAAAAAAAAAPAPAAAAAPAPAAAAAAKGGGRRRKRTKKSKK